LQLTLQLNDEIIARLIFDGFAALFTENGELENAAKLAAVAEGRGEEIGFTMEPAETGFRDAYLAKLRTIMDPNEFENAYAEGRILPLKAAIQIALQMNESYGAV